MDQTTRTEPVSTPRPKLQQRLKLPSVSGGASAFTLVICFAVTALLIPMASHLPHWVGFEIVLAVWWCVWVVVLTALLHSGRQVTDDHSLSPARSWDIAGKVGPGPDIVDIACSSSAAMIGLLCVAVFILLAAAWFLIEVAIPALAFLMYLLVRGMLATAVNDRKGCRGNLVRSAVWGIVWATTYTAPLAIVVWLVHFIHFAGDLRSVPMITTLTITGLGILIWLVLFINSLRSPVE
jgi:hypothetical protein